MKAGTPVHTTITGRSASNALLVPLEAVQTGPDGESKFVLVIKRWNCRQARGDRWASEPPNQRRLSVASRPADTVITTGGYGLDDGTKVKVGTPLPTAEAGGEKE